MDIQSSQEFLLFFSENWFTTLPRIFFLRILIKDIIKNTELYSRLILNCVLRIWYHFALYLFAYKIVIVGTKRSSHCAWSLALYLYLRNAKISYKYYFIYLYMRVYVVWSHINNICKEKRSYYLTMTYAHDKCAHDLT